MFDVWMQHLDCSVGLDNKLPAGAGPHHACEEEEKEATTRGGGGPPSGVTHDYDW